MKLSVIVGVDVSKSTLEIFVRPTGHGMQINNKASGFKQWLKKPAGQPAEQMLVMMEHTLD